MGRGNGYLNPPSIVTSRPTRWYRWQAYFDMFRPTSQPHVRSNPPIRLPFCSTGTVSPGDYRRHKFGPTDLGVKFRGTLQRSLRLTSLECSGFVLHRGRQDFLNGVSVRPLLTSRLHGYSGL